MFVGNLSFETTRDELQDLFSQVAEVVAVAIPTDRFSGQARGFAFVEFSSSEQAAAAIQKFDGFELAGRRLRVNEASERPPRSPSAGFDRPFSGHDRPVKHTRPKGSRRNLRSRKRSIW